MTSEEKQQLQQVAEQIKAINLHLRKAMQGISNLGYDYSEEELKELAVLLEHFYREEGFERPYSWNDYEFFVQEFKTIMQQIETIIKHKFGGGVK